MLLVKSLLICAAAVTYLRACEAPADIVIRRLQSRSQRSIDDRLASSADEDPPPPPEEQEPMLPPPHCKSERSLALHHAERGKTQFNTLTKCLLGDNPDPSSTEGATKCETWSVNVVIALSADSTDADLDHVKAFLKSINQYCDERTMVSIFAPGFPNAKCESSLSLDTTLVDTLGGLATFKLAKADDTYEVTRDLYGQQLECSRTDPSQLGGLTVVFTNSDCADYCTYADRTEHPPLNNPRWTKLYYSGAWDASCPTNARSIFDFLDCEDNEEKCKVVKMALADLGSEEESCMRTCKNPAVIDLGQLLLIIGIPCATMIIIALGCAYFCYKKSNIRWRKFFLREQLQKHNLTVEEIKEFNKSCSPPSPGSMARLSHKDSSATTPSSRKLNHYSDFMRTIDEDVCEWEIGPGNLLILENKVLGHGAFATVCKGVISGRIPLLDVYPTLALNCKHGDEIEVAVKRMPNHADGYARADFEKEIEFMKTLGYHRHIVSMFGAVTTSIDPILVVEFCQHGDLLRFLRSRNKHVLVDDDEDCPVDAEICLRVKDLVSIAWQIADGMSYLSSLNFIHRDLAARNVLLTSSLVAKISDFGLGRRVDSTLYMAKGGRLPLKWMPPEALKFNEFSQKSDVWSFGIVLYELFSLGKQPFPLVQPFEMVEYLEGGGRPPHPPLCPPPVFELQSWSLSLSACARPTFEEAKCALGDLLNTNDEKYGYLDLAEGKSADATLHALMNNIAEGEKSDEDDTVVPLSPSQEVEWLYLSDRKDEKHGEERKRSVSMNVEPSPTCLCAQPSPLHRAASSTVLDRRRELLRQSALLEGAEPCSCASSSSSSDLPPLPPPPPPPPPLITCTSPAPRTGSCSGLSERRRMTSLTVEIPPRPEPCNCPHAAATAFEPPPPYSESWPASHRCDRTLEEGLEGVGSIMP